jgi:O-methyltransferase
MASLYEKYQDYTLCNEPVFEANLTLAGEVREVPGDLVECGVWKGGMIAAIYERLRQRRQVHLFDSFQGLPKAETIDGPAAMRWQQSSADNCMVNSGFAISAMEMAHCRTYEVHEGWFHDTLIHYEGSIALLRLDADWYESTWQCLELLFNRVVKNGIIIIDDYYVWDGCARAVHEFLSNKDLTERIEQAGNVAFMRKL